MTETKSSTLSASENIPLCVREALMRGNREEAIYLLSEKSKISQTEAKEIINHYRNRLKERQLELEIKITQEKEKEKAQQNNQRKVIIVTRISFLILFFIILLAQFF